MAAQGIEEVRARPADRADEPVDVAQLEAVSHLQLGEVDKHEFAEVDAKRGFFPIEETTSCWT